LAIASAVDAMKPWSLRLRLLTFAALGISLVLGAAGFGFNWLYQRHVEKFVMTELTSHLEQLLAVVNVNKEGKVEVTNDLSDPRFDQAEGGLYWQIDVKDQMSLRSRSLWDQALTVPTPPDDPEEDHAHIMQLPSGREMFALEKLIIASSADGIEKKMVVTVGIDRDRITNPVTEFSRAMMMGLAATYLALLASTLAIITFGLRPLQAVKRGIAAMREGQTHLETANLPEEVVPLADEVNALMQSREKQMERARQRASNLAHGLKTPLAVMQALSNDLRLKGQLQEADGLSLNASQMRDLVDRELTRSRMTDGRNAHSTALEPILSKVIATMKKAPRGDVILWNVALPQNIHVSVESVDLTELLGNLLDNARKHATEQVRISHDGKSLTVEDDGHGVSEAQMQSILQRGVRLDEKRPGSGIGLAIVSDLAEVYGLTLDVRKSGLGGLEISVGMPAA
jgi:signal transduction histidine kinase